MTVHTWTGTGWNHHSGRCWSHLQIWRGEEHIAEATAPVTSKDPPKFEPAIAPFKQCTTQDIIKGEVIPKTLQIPVPSAKRIGSINDLSFLSGLKKIYSSEW